MVEYLAPRRVGRHRQIAINRRNNVVGNVADELGVLDVCLRHVVYARAAHYFGAGNGKRMGEKIGFKR